MGHGGAGTGAGAEPGHWGRASPTSRIPISLSPASSSTRQLKPPMSFGWVAVASCRVQGSAVMLRAASYGGASWVMDAGGSLQPLAQPCHVKCSHAPGFFPLSLSYFWVVFSLLFLTEREFIEP